MKQPFLYQHIVIIGSTGSGKTTLGRALSERLRFPFIELDALYWEENWTPAYVLDFRDRVDKATSTPAWIVDGNYSVSRDIIWGRADTLVWLDYGFWLCLGRLLHRTIRRTYTRELLWSGNRENGWNQLRVWSQDSLIRWFFKTYWRRKREIATLLKLPEFEHLKAFRFKSPKETEAWLTRL